MKTSIICVVFVGILAVSCSKQPDDLDWNPFFSDFGTPFETPPFDRIEVTHYLPAFREGMKKHRAEVDAIIENSGEPTFENTIEALENSGTLLTKVSNIFFVLNSTMTNEEMQAVAREVTPLLSKHQDDISLDPRLFEKVKILWEKRETLDLNTEQQKLLDNTYKGFVRGGANLSAEAKARFRKINEELSLLTLKFGDNVLKDTNAFEMVIEKEGDLAGLPPSVRAGAAEAAEERGHSGKWVFTIHKPSMIPFLQFSERRDLREKIFKAYINKGNNDDEQDNKSILSRIASLRAERAHLLGYQTHAHFVLEPNMAKVPENVTTLLQQIWEPALRAAKLEAAEMQAMIDEEGGGFKLQAWDWWYYAEKIKKAKYDLEDSALRPYFKLENVIDGAFTVANKLYGLQFEERKDIPVYHEDVKVFEVKEADGTHVGILFTDYFPRESKRGGAWMNAFRKQSRRQGQKIMPLITNNGNFSKPTEDRPSLISFEEVRTLFHEFGHALHGLLSDCTYESLSGTSVPLDFVELPSQIMENWASHPDVLKLYARHYQTGEPIPRDLIDKLERSKYFNQGFAAVEYLAAAFLDMDWHTLTETEERDCWEFEKASMKRIGLIPEIVVRYRSPYFQHIFSGEYSAGYYSYIWAEVLDADAFDAFRQKGLFDQATAAAFRRYILSSGGTDDPMEMYKRFRGAEPGVDALLRRKGFK